MSSILNNFYNLKYDKNIKYKYFINTETWHNIYYLKCLNLNKHF